MITVTTRKTISRVFIPLRTGYIYSVLRALRSACAPQKLSINLLAFIVIIIRHFICFYLCSDAFDKVAAADTSEIL